jgi:drug/metabolite transporter (DMT)-like permease
MSKQKYLLPILAVILANVLWGISTPLIKVGLQSIPVPIFISTRFFVAALLLMPLARRVWRPFKGSQWLMLILAAVLDITLSVPAVNLGLTKTTASNAGIIWLLMPVLLFLLSVAFLKEKLSLKTFIGIMLALAGALIIIGKPWHSGGMTSLTGNLLVLLAVFLNALAIIIIKPLTKLFHHWQITFMYYLVGTNHVPDLPRVGGGSFDGISFEGRAQEMPVLDRWRMFAEDEESRTLYVPLVTPEVSELNQELFGFSPLLAA